MVARGPQRPLDDQRSGEEEQREQKRERKRGEGRRGRGQGGQWWLSKGLGWLDLPSRLPMDRNRIVYSYFDLSAFIFLPTHCEVSPNK